MPKVVRDTDAFCDAKGKKERNARESVKRRHIIKEGRL